MVEAVEVLLRRARSGYDGCWLLAVPGQREDGTTVDARGLQEPQRALALEEPVDDVQLDPDAGDEASRGFVVGRERRPHAVHAAGGGNGRDSVHEGGADAETVVVVDDLDGDLGDAASTCTLRAMPTGRPSSDASQATCRCPSTAVSAPSIIAGSRTIPVR